MALGGLGQGGSGLRVQKWKSAWRPAFPTSTPQQSPQGDTTGRTAELTCLHKGAF